MKPSSQKILWLILFSIAMGLLETVVVVYLREIYYPQGFAFPLTVMDQRLLVVELLREAATIIMLLGIGMLAGATPNQRFAFFLAAFGIWDIFYYIFLKILLNWPESLLTWDILFLIPVPWIGPVLAPCLVSLTMLLLATALYQRDPKRLNVWEWLLLIAGSQVIILSWTLDYFSLTAGKPFSSEETMRALAAYIPASYNWWLFGLGEILLLAAIAIFWKRTGRISQN